MAVKTLAEKMKFKPGMAGGVVNAPSGYIATFAAPKGASVKTDLGAGPFDWLQILVRSQSELSALADRLMPALRPASLLWICFPKGASKIQTDLTHDRGWDALRGLPLKWINLKSIDETWSAFSLRPYKPGEKSNRLGEIPDRILSAPPTSRRPPGSRRGTLAAKIQRADGDGHAVESARRLQTPVGSPQRDRRGQTAGRIVLGATGRSSLRLRAIH